VLGTCWAGFHLYTYFFDTTNPFLVIHGIESQGYYAGDVACCISSSKTGELSLMLDNTALADKFSISTRNHEYVFTIPTGALSHGKHILKARICDSCFGKNTTELTRDFYVDNTPLQAALIKSEPIYKIFQGRTLHLQLQTNKPIAHATVELLSHTYTFFPESKNSLVYEAFIPITCEEKPNEYLFTAHVTDHVGNSATLENKFQVVLYPFKKQNLQVSAEKMEEEEKLGHDVKHFEECIETITRQSPAEKLWHGSFCTPIDVERVSCEFGTIRTTQKKGRYAHKALDVLNAPRSVVWASQDGIIALKERFAFSGNTVVIDHGYGLLSLYCHLEDFAHIAVGEKIAKGSPLGTLGKTGYASGYHLHWEMRLANIAIDPMQWTRETF
ncbi:MAG TPA: M23 family metallopeptidase, partial [Candidatus Bathyarchaeia archaeon]|nr:M23 family metallopeptidase [Candidatus Bathyarchaeia archaeon]